MAPAKRRTLVYYSISSNENTYYLLDFDYLTSTDASLFAEGVNIENLAVSLKYKVKNRKSFNKLKNLHFISSTGPELVSAQLRAVIEELSPLEVNFFDSVAIEFKGDRLEGFSAINCMHIENCCDLTLSEYEQTNFDPVDPKYLFLYTVFRSQLKNNVRIARCAEQKAHIVVCEDIKIACFERKLSGLTFSKSIDLTPENRSSSESTSSNTRKTRQ